MSKFFHLQPFFLFNLVFNTFSANFWSQEDWLNLADEVLVPGSRLSLFIDKFVKNYRNAEETWGSPVVLAHVLSRLSTLQEVLKPGLAKES